MSRGAVVFWVWAASLVLVWIGVALSLNQPLWAQQHSIALTAFGAFEGQTLTFGDAWKLVVSQWLHVKFPHMLFNALIIGLVGTALSRRMAWPWALALGVFGGACGQLAAAILQPEAYISGASQAYLALCGAALILLPWRSVGFGAAVVGTLVGAGLDLFVADHGGIKPGHWIPFLIGAIAGSGVWLASRRKA